MSGLRDRLLARPRAWASYPVRIDDDTAARAAVEQARQTLALIQMQSQLTEDGEAVAAAQQAVATAEELLRGCYEQVVLRALPPKRWEDLVGKHPLRPGSTDEVWNTETFPRAAFVACVEGDLTSAEWDQVLDEVLSQAERVRLCNAAIAVNVRVPDQTLPKDWTWMLL